MQNSVNNKLNKKAQDLSIGTLILIVLGIIVLVLLILGFSYGWSSLWEKINIFGGGGSSIADVVTNCNLAVTSNAVYTYCNDFKKIKVNNEIEYVNCEDSRVTQGVTTKITCTGDVNDRIKEQCIYLIKSGNVKEDTKANQQPCWETYTCENLRGTPAEKGNCQDNTKEINSKGIKDLGNLVCCMPNTP